MSWTTHGHHIPGTMLDRSQRPASIAGCGGPSECTQCQRETRATSPLINQNIEKPTLNNAGLTEPIKEGLPDPQLEEVFGDDEPTGFGFTGNLDQELDYQRSEPSANRKRYIEAFLKEDRSSIGEEALRARFGYHKAIDLTAPMHQAVCQIFYDGALILDKMLPNGRAKFQAIVELELASMWANKAIAEMAPVVEE